MDNNIIEYTEKAIHRQMAVTGKSAKRLLEGLMKFDWNVFLRCQKSKH